jgi:hypothetical protein
MATPEPAELGTSTKISIMKKNIFITGSVFQFYVPEIKKYACCKIFDFTHLSKFHGQLVQVYDYFSDNEIEEFEKLEECEWLFGHKSVHKWPNLRKDTNWKFLGSLYKEEDNVIPDFKEVQAFTNISQSESAFGPWYPIHNLITRGNYCDYEKVHHLELINLTTLSLGITWRTGMEYCRINSLEIKDFYNLTDESIEKTYYQMINVPIYKTIPKEIRGKAIT